MPDASPPASNVPDAFTDAARKAGNALCLLGGQVVALSAADLAAYPFRDFKAGWRLAVHFPDASRRLDLLLPSGFPWRAPRISLVDRPPFLSWPHVERDGLLCLAPASLEVDPSNPAAAATCLLGLGAGLVEKLLRGECDQDFADEFLSYWGFEADYPGVPIISLIDPRPPSRRLRVWRGKSQYVIGEDESAIERWLANRFGSKPAGFRTEAAAHIWLGPAPMPRDYPSSPQDFRALVGKTGGGAGAILDELASGRPDKMVSVIAVSTINGPAFGAVILAPLAEREHGPRNPLTKGFRPGHLPPNIALARYFGGAKLWRGEVERADAAWIHGRGEDDRAVILLQKTVALVGCGSIGAPVAMALAQAGVGRIVLIDFDILKWANVGRHPLGASQVGQAKAVSLAKRLQADFPHAVIEAHVADVDSLIRTDPRVLSSCDLIISATGSWAADGRLDAWQEGNARVPPVVYAWTEPHACAGHAVLIGKEATLRTGFDATGLPLLQVTSWPSAERQQQEPACGAVYQPYGPVELGFINSIVAELALDALLREGMASVHRIWAGQQRRLRELGGEWSPAWLALAHGRADGGFTLDQSWGASPIPDAEAVAA